MTPPVERTDEELVTAAQAGDRRALETLLAVHYDRLYAVCRRLANNDADAADATQEALMAIVRGLGRFDGRSSFRTWSYRVATNACLDELRRRSRRPLPVVDDEVVPVVDESAGRALQRTEDRWELERALEQLPEEFRTPVVLRDVGGFDYAEIGRILDLAPGTVRSRISRGRRHLAQLVGNQRAPDERQNR